MPARNVSTGSRDGSAAGIDHTRRSRKLRSLHNQAPGTALLWQRKAELRLAELTAAHPELTRTPQPFPKTRKPTRRHRLAVLLEDRKTQLALMKKRASDDLKPQISLEYNRTCNWLNMVDKMGVTKVSELWEQLQKENLASTFSNV